MGAWWVARGYDECVAAIRAATSDRLTDLFGNVDAAARGQAVGAFHRLKAKIIECVRENAMSGITSLTPRLVCSLDNFVAAAIVDRVLF